MSQQRVDLTTADGVMDCYLARPTGQGPWPAVLFYMDAMGIRPAFLAMAQRLADAGYVVMTPNLYYRQGPHAPFDPATAFAEGPEHDRLRGLLASIDNAAVMRDTSACVAHLDGSPDVQPGGCGAVGYCMGGRQALMAAGTLPERVRAVASLHGAALCTARPESPHRLASRMRGTLYLGVAETDHTFSHEERQRLEAALTEAGVSYTLEEYAGTRHGFAVTDHPAYDRVAAERHWTRVLDLLGTALKTPR